MKILADHDTEGEALILAGLLISEGGPEIGDLEFTTFAAEGLDVRSNDRQVWRFCQAQNMILLTGNRNEDDPDSLALAIKEENAATSLPVVTIGVPGRIREKRYRDRCLNRLMGIILDLENLRGVGRLYIP